MKTIKNQNPDVDTTLVTMMYDGVLHLVRVMCYAKRKAVARVLDAQGMPEHILVQSGKDPNHFLDENTYKEYRLVNKHLMGI